VTDRPPAEMSDAELIEACRLTPQERRWEQTLDSRWGCGSVLLVVAIVLYVANAAWKWAAGGGLHWGVLILSGFFMAGTLYLRLHGWAERRREVYWAELRRRYAEPGLDEMERETTQGGRRAGADRVVIVHGAALPHGGYWLTRVWLRPDGGGWVERRTLSPFVLPGAREPIRLGAGEVPLSPEENARVRELAAAEFRGHISATVKDGAPARVIVWERGRGVTRRGSCNLAGVPERKREHPMIRLMTVVEELGRRVDVPGLLVGSCDFAGNIRIGEM
jgi:hypothetical protein